MPDEAHPDTGLQKVRPYSTMTRSLLLLAGRLAGLGVTRVVMEWEAGVLPVGGARVRDVAGQCP